MSLRLRLIVAFFLLSVLPLAAVTMVSYANNAKALQAAAGREANLLADELTNRMQLVTAQLSERVEHLMGLPAPAVTQVATNTPAPVRPTTARPSSSTTGPAPATTTPLPAAPTPAPATTPTATTAAAALAASAEALQQSPSTGMTDQIAQMLGETAMLLNNVELRGLGGLDRGMFRGESGGPPSGRGGGQGRGSRTDPPPPGSVRPPPPAPVVAATPPTAPVAGATPTPVPVVPVPPAQPGEPGSNRNSRRFTVPPPPPPLTGSRAGGGGANAASSDARGGAAVGGTNPTVTVQTARDGTVVRVPDVKDGKERILIDLAPIRQELYRQILPSGKRPEELSIEERQRVNREVTQRMRGIMQGIQLSANELQKKAADAQREHERVKAMEAARPAAKAPAPAAPPKPAPAPAPAPTPAMTTKTQLSGNRLGVVMEQNGQVVQQADAEINLPNVLATVFSTTKRDRGEVPFAVSKDGTLHAPSDEDRRRLVSLGPALAPEGPPTRTTVQGDWIVVTTADPSGSGLRFGVARPVGDSMADLRRTAARNASFGLLFIGLALVGIVPLSGRLTRNLTTLTEAASRIAHGDFRARVPVKSKDEIGKLATAFNRMAEDVERHQLAAVGQERIRRELELGRQIQHEMLPHAPFRLGLTEINGVSVPAREVGGDFFNYFEVEGGQIAILVGDVSGKGVGAALLMANIQASLRTRLALGQDLAAISDAIDRDIGANSPGPVYATLFVGILDPQTRQLRYVNAGHNPQYVLRRTGGLERMESTGLPVGLVAGRGYTERQAQLEAGDLLFLYTDGCVEAENDREDMFGAERLEALLTSRIATGPDDVLQRVEAAVTAFRGTREPFDDETMMAVRVG